MSLDKKIKNKILGAGVTEDFHAEVVQFVSDREWKMSEFIRQAIEESMVRVERREKRERK